MDTTTEETTYVKTAKEKLADKALAVAIKQFDTATLFQKPVFDRIQKNEDMLAGKSAPALKGRNNVPLDTVIMNGFQDTMLAGTDEPVNVKFKNQREQDLKSSRKVSAVWEREKQPSRGNFDAFILDSKWLASTSGRGFIKHWVESLPKFRACMDAVDHFDMLAEPMGGPYLDRHLFKGQQNIFRTNGELDAMVAAGVYNANQVSLLKAAFTPEMRKQNEDRYKFKLMRYAAMGMDVSSNDFIGEALYGMVEWVMFFEGEWRYMVFSYQAKTWVRFELLSDVFAHAKDYPGRGSWVSYATNRHPKMFWSRAILDDIRPIAYTMKKVLNLSLDNLEKRNWDMKAYDPKVFTDPTQLLYKQDGLAKATLERGKSIQAGIYQFTTPDTTGITINLNEYLDRFISTKTGVTTESQGDADAQTNGIYFGNLQQSQNRLSLKNKMFMQAVYDIGVIFDYGCWEHLNEKYAVKIMGPSGIEWEEEVRRDDLEREFSIDITGGNDEEKQNAEMLARKNQTLASIELNPALMSKVNPMWMLREKLTAGGYDDEKIRVALDTQNDGDEEIFSEAAEAIYMIVEGKKPKLNRGATSGYVQKIVDFCYDTESLSDQVFANLMAFAELHIPIAQQNMIRRARSVIATQGGDVMGMNAQNADQAARDLTTIPAPATAPVTPTVPVA
ncbi:MAG: hypothetical protein V4478_03290 [Patescibacteria group bacterium]